MKVHRLAGKTEVERALKEELEYLYKRLSTINDLIRSLERYDQYRREPLPVRPQNEEPA
jgi:hypothetical protein